MSVMCIRENPWDLWENHIICGSNLGGCEAVAMVYIQGAYHGIKRTMYIKKQALFPTPKYFGRNTRKYGTFRNRLIIRRL